MSPEKRKIKEERLRKLFRNRVFEMKDYLHRKFMKFYYNCIFMQMKNKNERDKPAKIVKSNRFSNLINVFNNNNNNNNSKNNGKSKLNRQSTVTQNVKFNENKFEKMKNIKKSMSIIGEQNYK